MAKGDRVLVLVDVGGYVQDFSVTATKAGRSVEIDVNRSLIIVSEVTRGHNVIHASRFMASRVVALVEEKIEVEPEKSRDENEPF